MVVGLISIVAFGLFMMAYAWIIALFIAVLVGIVASMILYEVRESYMPDTPFEFFLIPVVWVVYLFYYFLYGLFTDPFMIAIFALLGPFAFLPVVLWLVRFIRGR